MHIDTFTFFFFKHHIHCILLCRDILWKVKPIVRIPEPVSTSQCLTAQKHVLQGSLFCDANKTTVMQHVMPTHNIHCKSSHSAKPATPLVNRHLHMTDTLLFEKCTLKGTSKHLFAWVGFLPSQTVSIQSHTGCRKGWGGWVLSTSSQQIQNPASNRKSFPNLLKLHCHDGTWHWREEFVSVRTVCT